MQIRRIGAADRLIRAFGGEAGTILSGIQEVMTVKTSENLGSGGKVVARHKIPGSECGGARVVQ